MTALIRENVQSYPRPPDLQPVPHRLIIVLGGQVIANTTSALRVIETHHAPTYYLPRRDITGQMNMAAGTSLCEWKGKARYLDVIGGQVTARRAAWTYDRPTPRFAAIADHVAFYPALMEACFVDGEKVTPQLGGFYGGWVTSNLDGIPKGAAGTEHW